MTDTLEIFGTEYSGVTGIKATDENNNTKTYIRPDGTKSITANGNGIDVAAYATANVSVSPTLQSKSKSYTPTESAQSGTVTYDAGYDGLSSVGISVGAISSTYIGSGITQRTSSDLTASGATVTAPSGYYASSATKTVASGTAGTPTATKGAVNNHSISVTPSVTNTTGYITGSTKTGTAVTVSASELVSGSETKTANGTYDVTNLASLVVNVSDSGMVIATASTTLNAASTSISFTGLSGEPTSFAICSSADLTTGGTKAAAVVFDGTNVIGQTITSQVTYDGTNFSKSYSGGTLTVTGTASFQANTYTLVYTYGGTSANLGTADIQVGSGATSITFTGLTDEPDYFSCIFKSDFGTSSGYQRVITVVYDGSSTYGLAMDSGAKAQTSWSYTYNAGSLTITSTGTNNGGYFHQPGYYQLTYGVGGEPTPITTESLSVTSNGTYTAPAGKAYTPVVVNVSGGGASTVASKTASLSTAANTISFTGLNGTPIAWFARCTTQLSSSGSTTYYYVDSARYNGTNTQATLFRIGSTRRIQNQTTGISYTYNNGTLTVSTTATAATATPGFFYNGTYELTYIY